MKLNKYIDHTLLKPDATREQIVKLCEEARLYGFASVCVNPMWVSLCAKLLKDSDIKTCTVIGFPLGANFMDSKAAEAKLAVQMGASEIDMVMSIGVLKSGMPDLVAAEIGLVRSWIRGKTLKVIIETCLLTREEKVLACKLAKKAGADFVKTSTGFSTGGATPDDVKLMRRAVGPVMGVKASGGIKDYSTARDMIAAGATRLGCSAGVAIVNDPKNK